MYYIMEGEDVEDGQLHNRSPYEGQLQAPSHTSSRPQSRGSSACNPPFDAGQEDEDDSDDEEEEYNPELERDRNINDQRLKSRFEHIFGKYERDFTGVGDEIDLQTGEIVIDNGHLEHMRHENDPGASVSEQFAKAFAENLEQEDELSESGREESFEDGEDDDFDSDVESATGSNSGDFSAPEQDEDNATSPTEMDDISIDPLLTQLQDAAGLKPQHAVTSIASGDVLASSLPCGEAEMRATRETPSEQTESGRSTPLNVMELPAIKETMLALQSSSKQGGPVDAEAIQALGMNIANQIAQFMGSKRNEKGKKRKERGWDFPELPIDQQSRDLKAQRPKRPQLLSFSPVGKRLANEPKESLWAPVSHPRVHKKKRTTEPAQRAQTGQRDPTPLDGSAIVPEEAVIEMQIEEELQSSTETPFMKQCYHCGMQATPSWRKGPNGDLCNACGMYLYRYGLMKPLRGDSPSDSEDNEYRVRDPYDPSGSRRVTTSVAAKHTRFSAEEDALLIKLKEIDQRQWSHIGRHFPGRTAFAVQCRYSKKLLNVPSRGRNMLIEQGFDFSNLANREGGFTEAEDELIVQLREESEMGFEIIAQEHFVDKAATEIEERYRALLNGSAGQDQRIKKPRPQGDHLPKSIYHKFSEEEDALLNRLREFGDLTWDQLAVQFPTRTQLSLQKRYVRNLARRKAAAETKGERWPPPHLKNQCRGGLLRARRPRENYTHEEDNLLVRLRDDQGLDWHKISKQLPGRTPESVANRYLHIMRKLGRKPNSIEAESTEPTMYQPAPVEDTPMPYFIDPTLMKPEDSAPPMGTETALPEYPNIDRTSNAKYRTYYTEVDDKLIMHLRETDLLSWEQIALRFPGRSISGIMTHYNILLRANQRSKPLKAECPTVPELGENGVIYGDGATEPSLEGREAQRAANLHVELSEGPHHSRANDFGMPEPMPFASEMRTKNGKAARSGSRYTQEEKDRLIAYRKEERSWNEIAELLPGRSVRSLQNYWSVYLNPGNGGTQTVDAGPEKSSLARAESPKTALSKAETPLLRKTLDHNLWHHSAENKSQSLDARPRMNLFNTLIHSPADQAVAEELEETGCFDILKLEKISPKRPEDISALLVSPSLPIEYASPSNPTPSRAPAVLGQVAPVGWRPLVPLAQTQTQAGKQDAMNVTPSKACTPSGRLDDVQGIDDSLESTIDLTSPTAFKASSECIRTAGGGEIIAESEPSMAIAKSNEHPSNTSAVPIELSAPQATSLAAVVQMIPEQGEAEAALTSSSHDLRPGIPYAISPWTDSEPNHTVLGAATNGSGLGLPPTNIAAQGQSPKVLNTTTPSLQPAVDIREKRHDVAPNIATSLGGLPPYIIPPSRVATHGSLSEAAQLQVSAGIHASHALKRCTSASVIDQEHVRPTPCRSQSNISADVNIHTKYSPINRPASSQPFNQLDTKQHNETQVERPNFSSSQPATPAALSPEANTATGFSHAACSTPAVALYSTPGRYDQQAHPYFAAPHAPFYSPTFEKETSPLKEDCQDDDGNLLSSTYAIQSAPMSKLPAQRSCSLATGKPSTAAADEAVHRGTQYDHEAATTAESSAESGAESGVGGAAPIKPRSSWRVLIREALISMPKQRMSAKEIYEHIASKYPYYAHDVEGGKASVRGCLKRSPEFAKIGGRGGIWRLCSEHSLQPSLLVTGEEEEETAASEGGSMPEDSEGDSSTHTPAAAQMPNDGARSRAKLDLNHSDTASVASIDAEFEPAKKTAKPKAPKRVGRPRKRKDDDESDFTESAESAPSREPSMLGTVSDDDSDRALTPLHEGYGMEDLTHPTVGTEHDVVPGGLYNRALGLACHDSGEEDDPLGSTEVTIPQVAKLESKRPIFSSDVYRDPKSTPVPSCAPETDQHFEDLHVDGLPQLAQVSSFASSSSPAFAHAKKPMPMSVYCKGSVLSPPSVEALANLRMKQPSAFPGSFRDGSAHPSAARAEPNLSRSTSVALPGSTRRVVKTVVRPHLDGADDFEDELAL